MIKAILFDLDGTLLPMDQDTFVNAYLGGLANKMAPHGYDPKLLAKTMWEGTAAMVKNTGEETNESVFWKCFWQVFGDEALADMPIINDFYANEFQLVKNVCGFAPEAAQCIREIRDLGYRVALATNPLFPAAATHSRTRWAGLQVEDFELITTYENSYHCKPNVAYYQDVLEKLNLKPEECIMVGNDATEDTAAEALGIQVFLLTDCLINKENKDISKWPHGSFPELMNFIRELKA